MRVLIGGLGLCIGFALHGCGGPEPPVEPPVAPVTINVIDSNQQVIDENVEITTVGKPPFFDTHDSAVAPIWIPSTSRWIFSEASAVRGGFTYQYDPTSGVTSLWRHPNGQTIGLALDSAGTTLYMAEEGSRRISKTSNLANGQTGVTEVVSTTDDDGTVTQLLAPFDVVVSSEGMMFFSDDNPATGFGHVVRVNTSDPGSVGVTQSMVGLIDTAGLALNTEENMLWVVDQGQGHDFVCSYVIGELDITSPCSTLKGSDGGAMTFDGVAGIKVDESDNLWIAYNNGVDVYTKDGSKLVEIKVEGGVSNLAFGGADGRTVMLTAFEQIYILPTKVMSGVQRMRREAHVSV